MIGRIWGCTLAIFMLVSVGEAVAQLDSVYRTEDAGGKTRVRGRIAKMSAVEVSVETNDGIKKIPCREIKKITFSGEPRGLGRARDHFDNMRYGDCSEAIAKVDSSDGSPEIKQEIAFLTAAATAKRALRGDQGVSMQNAEDLLSAFVNDNKSSYRLVLAIDALAQVLMANGKADLAQKQFNSLTRSKWPEYVARGYFFEAESLVHAGELEQAQDSYQKLVNLQASEEEARQFQLLARCQLAKLAALNGEPGRAITVIEQLIKNENAENVRLFAYAYNALGTCHLQANDLKKACRAFLHTELLFSAEPNAHAEAVYQLAKIWPQLKQADRANRARELLNSRYRNTVWASKL